MQARRAGRHAGLSGAMFLALGLRARPAHAVEAPDDRDSARPCRPTVSCTADITTPGTLEVEAGELASVARGGAQEASFPAQLKQTFTSMLQLQVGSNGYTLVGPTPRARFLDNVVVGPKLHLVDQGALAPSLALSAEIGLPTFPAAGYALHDDAFVTAYASKDLGPLHADLNVGLLAWQLDASVQPQVFTALALSTALCSWLSVAAEGYVFSDAAPVASHDGGLRVALGLTARPWLVVDLGGDVGAYPDVRAYSFFAGATFIPVLWWRQP